MTTRTIRVDDRDYTVEQLAAIIGNHSERGEWYDGQFSTHVSEWIEEGDYTGDETLAALIAEWDS